MKLEGIHHVTAITADAQHNVDFYAGVLGLRLVKKSVNQDDTSVYHLFYADETGDAGSDITFFEYPGLPKGRAGAGHDPPHRVARAGSGGARLLAAAPLRRRLRLAAHRRHADLRRLRGPRARAARDADERRAADRQPPRDPG